MSAPLHADRHRALTRGVRARAGAIAVVTALLGAVLAAAPASAVAPDASNAYGSFTWGDPLLLDDADGDGLPDPGDTVVYPFELDVVSGWGLWDRSGLPNVEYGPRGASGWSAAVTVDASMLSADGSGPLVPGGPSCCST